MKKILLLSLISLPMFSMQPDRAKQAPQNFQRHNNVRNTAILTGTGAIVAAPLTGCLAIPILPMATTFIPAAIIGASVYRYMTTPANDNQVNDKIVIEKKTEDKNKNQ